MKVTSNWVDKLYQYIAPVAAVKRLQARQQMHFAQSYRGASRYQNSLSDWKVSSGDADSDLNWDLPTLRQRSRDLLRNNPLALGAINTICTNVIGTGLKLHARLDREVLKLTDEEADKWEANTEREFRLWAESTYCDAARTLTFTGLQELAFRSTLENGDCFVLLNYQNPQEFSKNSYSFQNPYSLRLQLIEADRICNKDDVADTDSLVQGVQKNSEGAPIAYHVLQRHPGNRTFSKVSREWGVVPAFSRTGRRLMLHLYSMRRASQTRGLPYLAPVIESLKQLDRYTQAEITAAVISSLFTVFVKTPEGDGNLVSKAINNHQNPHHYHLQGGNVVNLAHGEDITTANPGRPNEQFDPFIQAILRQIGVALELPFEVLIKHFTASYSAARAALLEAWRFFSAKRNWFAENFCQPVYEAWLLEAVSLGRVPAPGFLTSAAIRQAYLGSEWTGPAPGQIDPLKEIQAAKERVDMGISTLARETATLTGEDWEQIHRQAQKEQKMLKKSGINLASKENDKLI
jgi:lambda family phage portal protein